MIEEPHPQHDTGWVSVQLFSALVRLEPTRATPVLCASLTEKDYGALTAATTGSPPSRPLAHA